MVLVQPGFQQLSHEASQDHVWGHSGAQCGG